VNTEQLITDILVREGWDKYTNDPNDRGGPTKWGITLAAWRDYHARPVTPAEIEKITEGQAREFYRSEYIVRPGFNKIATDDLMELVVDCGVNHGVGRAARWLQQAAKVPVDGKIGPVSLAKVNATPWLVLFLRIVGYRARFYASIVERDPTQLKYLEGWIDRAADFLDEVADERASG
jgi:lysozyme family protein